MGNTYFPTKKGTDPSPQVGQAPASVRRGGPDPASVEANEVVNNTSDIVNAFVHAQRQNVANSVATYHAQHLDHPDVEVRYVNDSGAETITVTPKSRPKPPSPVEQALHLLESEGVPIPEIPLSLEHPSKYLMVLFKQDDKTDPLTGKRLGDGIAAFKMSSLTSTGCGSPDFLGRSQESRWVDTVGKILMVGQYSFGTTGYILCPIDFAGPTATPPATHGAQTMMLSTTALTDGVATDGDITAIPILNAAGDGNLYTVGGKYRRIAGAFVQQQGMVRDPNNGLVVTPYAIAPDGTSYFFTTVHGDVTAYIDQSFAGPYVQSNAFNTEVFNAEQLLIDSLPNPDVYATYLAESTNVDFGAGHIKQTSDKTLTVYTVGTAKATATRIGESYYGQGTFGQPPHVVNLKLAEAASDAEIFDPAVNHTTIQTIPQIHSNPDFGNTCYLQSYDTGTGVPGVTAFGFSALATGAEPLIAYTDKDSFGGIAQLASGPIFTAEVSTQDQVQVSTSSLPGVTYPASADFGSDLATARAQYTAMKTLNAGATGLLGSREFVCTQLVGEQFSDPSLNTATGDVVNIEDLPWPASSASIEIVGGGFDVKAATDQHDPYRTGAHSGDRSRHTDFHLFDATITIDQTWPAAGGGHQAAVLPTLAVHAFPPALGHLGQTLPFYTLDGGKDLPDSTQVITTHTPYGVFPAAGIGSFTPWLHISNGKHCIQAFYVDTTPYAFVDGSTRTGFLQAIAKACKCEDWQIVAMFMDIELRTVKNVAKVQLPDYSVSANNPPPVPGH